MKVRPEHAAIGENGNWIAPGQIHPYQDRLWRDNSRMVVFRKSRRIGVTWAAVGKAIQRASRVNGQTTYYVSHTERGGYETMADAIWWAHRFDAAERLSTGGVRTPQGIKGGKSIFIDGKPSRSIAKGSITFASGYKFQVMPSRGRNLRGPPGRVHYLIDELAFHLEPDKIIAAAGPILMLGGTRITIISTVMFEDDFWNLCEETIEMIEDARAGGPRSIRSFHQVTFDDALADGFYEREAWAAAVDISTGALEPEDAMPVSCPRLAAELERIIGPERLEGRSLLDPHARAAYRELVWSEMSAPDTELACIPMRSGTLYMSKELCARGYSTRCEVFRFDAPRDFLSRPENVRQAHIAEWMSGPGRVIERLAQLPKRKWYYGVDFGRSRDLTVMTFGYIENGRPVAAFVLELSDVPFDDQDFFFDQVVDRCDIIAGGALDKGGNGAQLAEHALKKLGEHRAEGIQFNQAWYIEHNSNMKRLFEDGSVEIPKDPFLVSDLCQIQLIDGVPRVPRTDRRKMVGAMAAGNARFRHGDFAISLALFLYAAQHAIAKKSRPGSGFLGRKARTSSKRRRVI